MEIGKISQYGFFDSKKQFLSVKKTPQREVSDFEIDYLLECDGDATSFIDGQAYNLRPNTIIFRKPRQKCHSTLNFKCYCLHVRLSDKSELYKKLTCLPDFFSLIDGKKYKLVLEQLFHHLLDKGIDCQDYMVAAKLLELFHFLITDSATYNETTYSVSSRESSGVKASVDYIKKNFNTKITLSTLGKLSGYTPNHFQKIFKRFMGSSPQKFIEEIRVSHAKRLLYKQEKSIADVAYECGFCSQSHFSYVFKLSTGMTPHEYRSSCEIKLN